MQGGSSHELVDLICRSLARLDPSLRETDSIWSNAKTVSEMIQTLTIG